VKIFGFKFQTAYYVIARSEATKQSRAMHAALDCRVAPLLAMTMERHESTFSRRISPEFRIIHHPRDHRGHREGRVAAAPGALAQKEFARAREPQVQAVTTGLPCAVGYGLIRALPGEPAFATVALARPLEPSARAWRLHGRARTTRLRRPRHCRSSHGIDPSTAFRTTFVTTRTPLHRQRNGGSKSCISEKRNMNIFRSRTGQAKSA
jgi:hypothetical protein